MIGTSLPVKLRVDCVPLSEFNFSVSFEVVELPSDEGVIVGVLLRGDERSSPIGVNSEFLELFFADWGEEFEPVIWVLEGGNIILGQIESFQDFKLGQ